MNRQQAKEKYFELRSSGYSDEEARAELKAVLSGAQSNDPTAEYWDKLVKQESGGRQSAVSKKGAVGIAQVMPTTGPEAAELAGREWDERAWREDPEYNAAIGRAYLRKQMKDFGDPRLGLAAYNAGPGRVREHINEGRPLPGETQKYVPAIAGQGQKMNRDQARAYAQKRLSEGADLATVKQELQSMAAPARPQPVAQQAPATPVPAPMQAQQVAQPQPAPAPVPQPAPAPVQPEQGAGGELSRPEDIDQRMLEQLQKVYQGRGGDQAGVLDRLSHGTGLGALKLMRGARGLWNALRDEPDPKLDEYLRNQEAVQRRYGQAINPSGSGLNAIDVGEMLPATAAFSAMGPSAGAGLGSTLLASTAAGALQGAASPLAPGESRLDNTTIGGGIGLLAGGASSAGKLANFLRDRSKNTIGAREAIDDFSGRVLGEGRGSDNIPTYGRVADAVKQKVASLEDDFTKAYASVERAPDLPEVTLLPSAKAGGEFKLTDEISKVLTPKTQKLLARMDKATNTTSPIVDEAGNPISSPAKTTFEDVRTAIREIRSTSRKLNRDDVSRIQLKRAENMLQDDLLTWATNKGNGARKAYEAAKELDTAYRQQVVPFYSKKTPVGKYLASEVLDEKALNSSFLGDDTGSAIKDLTKRVPGTEKDLRKLYGSKLREARGDVMTIRKLESGTTGEALLSKPEREYLLNVAKEIYKEGGPAQHSSVMPTGLMRLLEKTTFSQDLQRMIGGLRPYGVKKPDKYLSKKSEKLIDYLRTLGTQQAVED